MAVSSADRSSGRPGRAAAAWRDIPQRWAERIADGPPRGAAVDGRRICATVHDPVDTVSPRSFAAFRCDTPGVSPQNAANDLGAGGGAGEGRAAGGRAGAGRVHPIEAPRLVPILSMTTPERPDVPALGHQSRQGVFRRVHALAPPRGRHRVRGRSGPRAGRRARLERLGRPARRLVDGRQATRPRPRRPRPAGSRRQAPAAHRRAARPRRGPARAQDRPPRRPDHRGGHRDRPDRRLRPSRTHRARRAVLHRQRRRRQPGAGALRRRGRRPRSVHQRAADPARRGRQRR